jgi:hypothetical protein
MHLCAAVRRATACVCIDLLSSCLLCRTSAPEVAASMVQQPAKWAADLSAGSLALGAGIPQALPLSAREPPVTGALRQMLDCYRPGVPSCLRQ